MANPFDHWWTFLFAVWDHAFTLAAGCVVTVVVNLVEKHWMNGKKLPWKADLAILLGFVFFACFQAWHDEYKQVASLTRPAPQPSIVVNVPALNVPPAQVVVQQITQPKAKSDTFVQIKGVGAVDGRQPITVGRSIQLNVWVGKYGRDPVRTRQAFRLIVASVAEEAQIQADYLNQLHVQDKRDGVIFGLPGALGQTEFREQVASAPLTREDIDGMTAGERRLYLLAALDWKNDDGSVDHLFRCAWLQWSGIPPIPATPNHFIINACHSSPKGS